MKKEHTKEVATIKAKCTGCQKTSELDSQQIFEAEKAGCAISRCCFMPMVVVSVKTKKVK